MPETAKDCAIMLTRPGVKACGPYQREVEYIVGKDVEVTEAHRLVDAKGFVIVRGTLPAIKKTKQEG